MATLKYLLQSKSENSNIYARYSINRTAVFKRKTGFVINPKDWSEDKSQPIQKNEELKALKSKLDKLAVFVNDAYNNAINTGVEFTGSWLQLQIDLFNNKIVVVDLDVLTNSINAYIDNNEDLRRGSIKNLENLKKFITNYETDYLKGKQVLIRDIDLNFIDTFKKYHISKGRSVNYIGTYISLLRAVVNKASLSGIPIHPQFKQIKAIKEVKEPDQVIILNEQEQDLIKNVVLVREAHINARKWLLLGCLIGQRSSDLLNITDKNIKDIQGMKIIELKQQKTGKLVAIPLLPDALEIIENGLPYKINLEHFNKYSKEVCKEAKIDTTVKGKMRIDNKRTLTAGFYKKWQVVSSHVCRRSFATNFYGKIPTPVLMNITGHSTESMFLSYIGKTTYDNAYQMLEYFNKLDVK
ncbi:phage integrase SAM-like domain-containing protein [Flavobacterium sp. ov086]|uniref:phage integrase SAM-like domain-containing protein n=1 Tax=Flavobacterium sp. ov086 TaxID=1761785 RepID=UPI000B73F8FA|nr:phage integrase SAM-like domain-containing protein [Flavobacterium sp. ov086]SNR71985.1 Phage integrase family protein [Flavobacterium sp. ov086]